MFDTLTVVIPWVFAVVGLGIVFYMIQQNGRILLRLDALDEKLAALAPKPAPPPPPPLPVGSEAPAFELPDLDGNVHTLAEHRGRPAVLAFFGPHCGFCTRMAEQIGERWADDGTGPALVLVTSGSADDNRGMVDDADLKCPVYLQKQGEVMEAYRVTGTPSGYLIDADGKIASPLTVGADALFALLGVPAETAPGTTGGTAASAGGCGNCKKKKAGAAHPGTGGTGANDPASDGCAAATPSGVAFKDGGSVGGLVAALAARGAELPRLRVDFSAPHGTPGRDTELRALRKFVRANPEWAVVEQPDPAAGYLVVSRDPKDRKPLPSKLAMLTSLAKAVVGHVGDGRRRVTAGQLEERLEVCALCDKRTDDRCSACGCFLTTKAEWRSSDCPLGKWPKALPVVAGTGA